MEATAHERNHYGLLFQNLRLEQGLSIDDMANIILVPASFLQAVEEGQECLSSADLNMAANVFGVSKDALEQGQKEPATGREDLQTLLGELIGVCKNLQECNEELRKELSTIRGELDLSDEHVEEPVVNHSDVEEESSDAVQFDITVSKPLTR